CGRIGTRTSHPRSQRLGPKRWKQATAPRAWGRIVSPTFHPQSQRLGGRRHLLRAVRSARMGWDAWIRTVEVEPSLYAADFARLGDQIETLLHAGARIFHFDIGDAHFVEPVTMGPIVLHSIAPLVHRNGGVIDCHLMVDDPAHHFAALEAAGA